MLPPDQEVPDFITRSAVGLFPSGELITYGVYGLGVSVFFVHVLFCVILVFTSKRKHLLATLLSLEFIVIILYTFLYHYLNRYDF